MSEKPTPAECAYSAWCAQYHGAPSGIPTWRPWSQLDDAIQRAWGSAAGAAYLAHKGCDAPRLEELLAEIETLRADLARDEETRTLLSALSESCVACEGTGHYADGDCDVCGGYDPAGALERLRVCGEASAAVGSTSVMVGRRDLVTLVGEVDRLVKIAKGGAE